MCYTYRFNKMSCTSAKEHNSTSETCSGEHTVRARGDNRTTSKHIYRAIIASYVAARSHERNYNCLGIHEPSIDRTYDQIRGYFQGISDKKARRS